MSQFRLYGEFAHRYDLHTPPVHYQHDQSFVLEQVRRYTSGRLLDVGCGTGVLLRRARAEGIAAFGIDNAPEMIAECERHLEPAIARVLPMQELSDADTYDVISCLSWSLNYLADEAAVLDVLGRFHRALRATGTLVLQVAHAVHATGEVHEDREAGPGGQPEDVLLLYRFTKTGSTGADLRAQYVYASVSERELLHEDHLLHVADARVIAELAAEAGFLDVAVYESWKRDPFERALSPFVVGRKG